MNTDSMVRAQQWLMKYHRQLLLILICIGLIYSVGVHVQRFYLDFTTPAPEKIQQTQAPRQKALAINEFKLLFGQAEDKPRNLRSAEIPATTLSLILRGALAGGEPASAIIQGNDGQDRLYLVGETIAGGAVLESVHTQHVVINHNGRLQKLLFPEARSQQVESYTPPPPSSARSDRLPDGPVAEARELEERMERLRQRVNNDAGGQGN
ncbi:type II secretion system protein N [Parendozoicomonas haliclonae]|uniref:Type II secretion system protein N n=1 Tax=Parendozoicomonas haliclonae TaxID=1960125 RepID=A0A1X7AMA0_9GAMM|nr:type II secretion system protein N [Parendozoicomonas haliclonae]SMA49307.1 Type II secretion system protein N [Parendozoicomonas haliclonae]